MIRGLYTAGSGMILCNKQSDAIGENIDNLRSPGFREISERVTSFPRRLVNRVAASPDNPDIREEVPLGIMGTGVYADRKYYSTEPGILSQTENQTDLALNSDGYFVVETLAGERYTRNGHFLLDPSGLLRTAGGNLVLGENGPIGPLPEQFQVSLNGAIIDSETHAVIDNLRIAHIPAEDLEREGITSLFRTTGDPLETNREDVRIHQGFIEESNVNIDAQMVKMLKVIRAYSANQRIIQVNDSIMQKAVNEIGKV